jgi:hypothetical protein
MKSVVPVVLSAVVGTAFNLALALESQAQKNGSHTIHLVKQDVSAVNQPQWDAMRVELRPGSNDARHFLRGGEFVVILQGAGSLERVGEPSVTLTPGSVVPIGPTAESILKNISRTTTLKALVLFQVQKGKQPGSSPDRGSQAGSRNEGPPSKGDSQHHKPMQQQSPDLGLVF